MGDWPAVLAGAGRNTTVGATGSTLGTSTGVNAGVNTKSAWQDLSASTPHDADVVLLMVQSGVSNENYVLDVGVGATPDIIVPDLFCSWGQGSFVHTLWLPFQIAAGTQVRVRHQSNRSDAFTTLRVQAGLYQSTLLGQDLDMAMTAYGVTTSGATVGTTIDPGTTANTKGAWTTVTASTTKLHRSLVVAFGNQRNVGMTDTRWRFDIGLGGTGDAVDVTLFGDLYVAGAAAGNSISPAFIGPLPGDIPLGTRLAVRSQSTVTDATDRLLSVALYGL